MYCRTQLGELQGNLSKFGALGTEVWAVSSTDTADRLAAYAKAKGLTFPLLADRDLDLTKRYGVLDPTNAMMAVPAAIVIDRGGKVRFVRLDVDFRQRPPAQDLLDVVRQLKDE